MDFLEDFSKLFLEKHGKAIYDEICNKVKMEAKDACSKKYLQNVFMIALVDYWGMKDVQIEKFINNSTAIDNVKIKKIMRIHKESINEIQKYIKIANNSQNNR